MPLPTTPLPPDLVLSENLLETLLNVSLTGVIFFRPVCSPDGSITDLAYVHLNPAARQMLQLPVCPDDTFLTLYPNALETGIFAFYRDTFLSGETGRLDLNYSYDGLDNYFHLSAQRNGDVLVVSFTDTSDQPRTVVEQALRESQARENTARAEAEAGRRRLYEILMQAPASIVVFRGPEHTVELANPVYQQLVGYRELAGKPIKEAVPELAGQPFFPEMLDKVYRTGESFYGQEILVHSGRTNTGISEAVWLNIHYQATRDAAGRIDGIIAFAYQVTEQVVSRSQLQQLNQELEARVASRTREAQAAGQEAERQRLQLASLFEQAPIAVVVFRGPHLEIELANTAVCEFWGRTHAEVMHKPLLEALPEVAGQGFDILLSQVMGTGIPLRADEVSAILLRGGQPETVYFNHIYQPLYEPDGTISGVVVFAHEVTWQVRAREQAAAMQAEVLAAAEQRVRERETFYQVFEQTPASIVLLRGPGHRVEYHNQAYQQLFPGRQMRGRTIAEMQPDAASQGFLALLDGVYNTGETFFGRELKLDIDQPDGTRKETYFNFTYQAYRENDRITGVSVFAYDVTGQVRARQEREAQQRQLQEVFEQAPAAIFVVRGAEYVYEVVNPAMGQMLGVAPDQMLGKRYFDLFPALAGQGYRDLLDGVWHSGKEYVAREQAAQLPHHREDETGYYNFSYVPLREAEGSVTGIMCVAVEVTAQVLARRHVQELNHELAAINEELLVTNQELTETNIRLTRTNLDLDNFIYTASHDLKAPISNIDGLLTALLRSLSPDSLSSERVQGITGMMRASVERFKKTIANLTDIVKLQKENNQETSLVDLPEVIREVLLDLEPVIISSEAQIEVDVSGCPTIRFPEKNLRSVIYNLLSNAVKYRSPDREPRVSISCRHTGTEPVLCVTDNGLGMEPGRVNQLFTMFKRFHDHVEGTGIGLYMVKKIMDNAGGRIEVESQPGQGSSFSVFFPR